MPKSQIDVFDEIISEMRETFIKKNSDYGNAVEQGVDMIGWSYLASQLWNKVLRFINLGVKNAKQQVNDESIEDTLKDLANYAIIGVIIMRMRGK